MLPGHELRPPPDARVGRHLGDLASSRRPEAESLVERQVVGYAREDERLERRRLLDRREALVERVEGHRDTRAAAVQVARNLPGSRERMDHRGDGTELRGRIERDHALRRGRHRDRDPVARAEPEGRERVRTAVDGREQVAVGGGDAQEVVGDRLRRAPRGDGQCLVQRDLGVGERRRDVAVEAQPGTVGRGGTHVSLAASSGNRGRGGSWARGSSRYARALRASFAAWAPSR